MAEGEATGLGDGAPAPASLRPAAAVAVAALLAGVLLYLDAITPLGYWGGFLFIVPFLVVVAGVPRVSPLAAGAAAILLSAAGFLLSPSGISAATTLIGRAGPWVILTEVDVAVALVGRTASWLLIAGIAVVVDRHRRKSREARPLDDRYRVLFRRHDAAVLVIDPADGRIVDANPAAARFFWSSPDDLCSMRIADLNGTPGGSARWQEAMEGHRAPLRFVYRHASGEDRYVEVFSVPVAMEGRTLLYSAVYDVTDAHRAGKVLRESAARHRSLMDALPEGMVLYGVVAGPGGRVTDLRVLDINEAGERILGGTRAGMVGKTLRDPGEDPVLWFDALVRVAETGRPERVPVADPVGDRLFELRLSQPAPGHVAGLAIDMTERIRSEEALLHTNAELERFVLAASYDLREPLWTIASFAELLQCRYGDRLGPDAGELIAYILEGGRRMERLIEARLRDTRAGAVPLALEPVDVGEALAAVEASLASRISEAGAVVTCGPLPVVLADRLLLEQVLAGLLVHAISFRGAGYPTARVSAVREGDRWRICIAVIGNPAERDKEPLSRRRGGDRSAVQRIVERHGGSVRIEAGAGRTVLSFTLPAVGGAP